MHDSISPPWCGPNARTPADTESLRGAPVVATLRAASVEGGVTPLYPVHPGRVVKIDAHEGKAVKAGDPLFTLDETLARLQVDEARAALEGAQVQQKNAGILAK